MNAVIFDCIAFRWTNAAELGEGKNIIMCQIYDCGMWIGETMETFRIHVCRHKPPRHKSPTFTFNAVVGWMIRQTRESVMEKIRKGTRELRLQRRGP